jgi:hypothetical protein
MERSGRESNSKMKDYQNPWTHSNNNYLTPGDIQAAIDAGTDKLRLWNIVLMAIADHVCEDPSCCAFVAYNFKVKDEEDIDS